MPKKSKPFFCAVCCDIGLLGGGAPGAGGGAGVVEAIGDGVPPGGGSGGPLRPQAASIKAAAVKATSAKAMLRRLRTKKIPNLCRNGQFYQIASPRRDFDGHTLPAR